MRALAEFVMRGRVQAIGVALLGLVLSFLVWVSAATIGLVALRRSGQDIFVVLGWVLLASFSALLLLVDRGSEAAFFACIIAVLIAVAAAALVLRWMRSWPKALVTIVIVSLVSGFVISVAGASFVAQFAIELNEFFGKIRERMPEGQANLFGDLSAVQVGGLLVRFNVYLAVISLLIARWWQASLFNPGGFREEFHQLRLPWPVACSLIAAAFLMGVLGEDYSWWSGLFLMPLVIAGFALIHGVVGLKDWGRGPLIGLYLVCVLLGEMVTATLLLLALFDSWLDFRGRLRARAQ